MRRSHLSLGAVILAVASFIVTSCDLDSDSAGTQPNGSSSGACTSDADCSPGATCYTTYSPSLCIASVADCTSTSCPSGDACVQFSSGSALCFPACDAQSVSCTNSGACYPLAEGSDDGACEPPCTSDADCGSGSTCDASNGACYDDGVDAGGAGDSGGGTTGSGDDSGQPANGTACTANGNTWCADLQVCVNKTDRYWCYSETPGTTGMPSTSSVDEDFQRETCAGEPIYYNCSIVYAAEPAYPACQCAYAPAGGAANESCSSQGMLTCPYDSAGDFTCCPSGTDYVLTDSTGAPQCLSDPQSACMNDPQGRCPTECI